MAKKAKPAPKRKRPKSVMQKAWATRRAKKEALGAASYQGSKTAEISALRKETAGKGKLTHLSKARLRSMEKEAVILPLPDHSQPQTDKIGVQVEAILAAARSNNRAEARPEVRHRIYEMIHMAEYDGVSAGMAEAKAKQDEAILCSLVSGYRIRNRLDGSRFAPHVVGEVTMRAVVDLLKSLGYTANGRMNAEVGNQAT